MGVPQPRRPDGRPGTQARCYLTRRPGTQAPRGRGARQGPWLPRYGARVGPG